MGFKRLYSGCEACVGRDPQHRNIANNQILRRFEKTGTDVIQWFDWLAPVVKVRVRGASVVGAQLYRSMHVYTVFRLTGPCCCCTAGCWGTGRGPSCP